MSSVGSRPRVESLESNVWCFLDSSMTGVERDIASVTSND